MNRYFALILLTLAIALPGLSKIPVVDRDESHFAQATRQMLETGNYFQIRFQDVTRFQKPPGINWLQALFVKIFSDSGSSEIWPYRVPSVLGMLFAVLLTYAFGKRLYDDRVAFLAAVLLACSFLLVFEAHLAVTDAMLLATLVLMLGSLGLLYLEKGGSWWLFWLAMSAGFALKGVSPFIALLVMITLCIVDRDVRWVKRLRPILGLGIVLLTSSWLLLVNEAENTNYLGKMIEKDLMPKLQGGHESHGAYPGYHLKLLFFTLWPASLFLGAAAVWGWKFRKRPVEKFLLAWILPIWLFFELMPTKLPQYILPIFPAICLLASAALINGEKKRLTYLWALVSFVFIGLLFGANVWIHHKVYFSAGAFLLIMSLGVFSALYLKKGVTSLIACSVIGYGILFHVMIPGLQPIWVSQKVKSRLPAELSESSPLLINSFKEPSLVFLLGTKHVRYASFDEIGDLLKESGLALVTESQYETLSTVMDIEKLGEIKGLNYSKGKRVECFLVMKK